jgi:hypothetical protein
MPTQRPGPTLCVGVPAPVRWRNASDPRFYSRDRKGEGDSRLRLFNVGAGSFNKLLFGDIAVSSGLRRQNSKEARGARILREERLGRTSGERPNLRGRDVPDHRCARYIRRRAPIAQLAEAADLKSVQCRFESDWGHSDNRR